ncbi:MAG: 16S rRNA (cytosine(967)-C(5))-methyltransferase RsmB [Pyrinomonadaceae bacterium]|nr:16S rRNA (cytosine(967)-C(5))-methyltransferase RsmB [Pyrinomonadaceae bacterium]
MKNREEARRGKQPGSFERNLAVKPSSGVSEARRAAFDILRRVELESAYAAPLVLEAGERLRADDKRLCYELTLGVLRRQLWLDHLIEHYAQRKVSTLDLGVLLALRLGLYQLRFLTRVPVSAAVNESVNLVHEARLRSSAGLVNAVLRRAAREPQYDPAMEATNEIERIAIETSHPAWLIERWVERFGEIETKALAEANNKTPPVAFRINSLRADEEEVLEKIRADGGELKESEIAPGAWRAEGASKVLRRLSLEGKIYLQDEASQLVASVVNAQASERVLDVCAAPGSKTTHMAIESNDQALIVAGDIHAHRLRVVGESVARQSLQSVRRVLFDAERELPFVERVFDRVLVDAPCTGTGTLRRNPEIRWRITERNVAELSGIQKRILAQASKHVRAGGRLVYSTCSVEREENEEVVKAFLDKHNDFAVLPRAVPANFRTGFGAARTWPHRHDTDGFFIVALERKAVI